MVHRGCGKAEIKMKTKLLIGMLLLCGSLGFAQTSETSTKFESLDITKVPTGSILVSNPDGSWSWADPDDGCLINHGEQRVSISCKALFGSAESLEAAKHDALREDMIELTKERDDLLSKVQDLREKNKDYSEYIIRLQDDGLDWQRKAERYKKLYDEAVEQNYGYQKGWSFPVRPEDFRDRVTYGGGITIYQDQVTIGKGWTVEGLLIDTEHHVIRPAR